MAQLWRRAHGEPAAATGVSPLPGAQAGGVAAAVGASAGGAGSSSADGMATGLGHPRLLAAVALVRRCPGFWPSVAALSMYSHGDPGLREVAAEEAGLAAAASSAGPGALGGTSSSGGEPIATTRAVGAAGEDLFGGGTARSLAEAAGARRVEAQQRALFGDARPLPRTPDQQTGERRRAYGLSPEAVQNRALDQVKLAGFNAENAGWKPPHVAV